MAILEPNIEKFCRLSLAYFFAVNINFLGETAEKMFPLFSKKKNSKNDVIFSTVVGRLLAHL